MLRSLLPRLGWLTLAEANIGAAPPTWRELSFAAAPLLLATLTLLTLFDLGGSPRATVLVVGLAFVAWAWAAHRLAGRPLGAAQLLGVAALLRLLLMPLPATLSDDLLRYAWDGKVLLAGYNPYTLAPDAAELAPLRDRDWQIMPHRQVAAVYPPLALGLFTVAAATPTPLPVLKILLCLADLLTCLLLLPLADTLGVPSGRVMLYAWNPLVLLEVAGMGHVDALMAATMAAAVLALAGGRAGRAGLAAALAVAAKLLPLLAVPLWWRAARPRESRFLLIFLATLALFFVPLALSVGGLPPGLRTYGVSWEWNGPLYEPLWRLYDRVDLVPWLKARLDELRAASGRVEQIDPLYHWVYPQFLAKLTLAALLGALLVALYRRRPSPPGAAEGSLGAFLLCSATVYPWYLVGILPWAALARRRTWLFLSFTMVFSYLPQKIAGLPLFPGIWLLSWLPLFLGLALALPRSSR